MSKVTKRVNARQFWLTAQERHLLRTALLTLRAGTDSKATYIQEQQRNLFVARRIDDLHSMLAEPGVQKTATTEAA